MVDVPLPPDDIVTDVGLKETLGPLGETVPVRVIVPENPLRLARLMVVIDVEP